MPTRHLVLTRPRGVASTLAGRCTAAGWQVLDAALQAIGPASADEIAQARQAASDADLIVLVSPMAVSEAIKHLAVVLRGKPLAVMGAASRQSLLQAGMDDQQCIVSTSQDALGLLPDIRARLPAPGARVLVLRAQEGKDELLDALELAGYRTQTAAIYRRETLDWPSGLAEQIVARCDDAQARVAVLFTTASSVGHTLARFTPAQQAQIGTKAVAVASHPNVVKAAQNAGMQHVIPSLGDESAWFATLESLW